MILGVGIDIVEVRRMVSWLENGLAERYFTITEVEYCRSRGDRSAQSLAARFAAKEAFGKSLGIGIHGFALKDVEITVSADGGPLLQLHGAAKRAAEERGIKTVHVSLAHEREYATAAVVAEG